LISEKETPPHRSDRLALGRGGSTGGGWWRLVEEAGGGGCVYHALAVPDVWVVPRVGREHPPQRLDPLGPPEERMLRQTAVQILRPPARPPRPTTHIPTHATSATLRCLDNTRTPTHTTAHLRRRVFF
jgi:hypothetical protein